MEVCTIGGFEHVGNNMTAVKTGDDVFIFDMGFDIPSLIDMQEGERIHSYTEEKLRKYGAVPNDLILDKLGWSDKVRAIIVSHAHLDHVGLLPYLYKMGYKGPVYMTTPTRDIASLLSLDFIGVFSSLARFSKTAIEKAVPIITALGYL